MTKEHTSEEIKYRLSDLGVQIGNIAIKYISYLEKQIEEKENTIHTLDVLHKEAVKKYGDLNDQLAQAKEIIKKLMVFAEADLREYEEEYKEAEQFLKEE